MPPFGEPDMSRDNPKDTDLHFIIQYMCWRTQVLVREMRTKFFNQSQLQIKHYLSKCTWHELTISTTKDKKLQRQKMSWNQSSNRLILQQSEDEQNGYPKNNNELSKFWNSSGWRRSSHLICTWRFKDRLDFSKTRKVQASQAWTPQVLCTLTQMHGPSLVLTWEYGQKDRREY